MTSLKPKRLVGVGLIFLTLLSSTAQAAPNYQINYQGKLTDAAGTAVADGTYAVTFNLYTAASGGSTIWTEAHTAGNKVTVTNGLFSTMLGSLTSLSTVDFNQTLYLGVTVESDSEMTPRKVLGAVPAAFQADKLDNYDSTDFLSTTTASAPKLWTLTGLGQIGSSTATTTFLGNLTAVGTTVLNGILSVYQNVTAPYFTATSTDVASTFPYASTTAISATTASSTNLIASTAATFSFLGSGLTKVTNGALGLATAGTDYLTSAFKDWQISGGYLTPTTTQTVKLNNGFVSTASSTVSGLLTTDSASTTALTVTGTASTTNLVISRSIGIATDTPTALLSIYNGAVYSRTKGLHISDGTRNGYFYQFSSGGTFALQSSGDLLFEANGGSEIMRLIGSTKFVGVGTSTPGEKLSVDGNGLFNGKITGQYFIATSTAVGSIFPYASTTYISATTASTSALVASASASFNFLGTGLAKITNGALGLATAGTDYLTSAYQSWQLSGGYLTPTTTQTVLLNNGFVSAASSTVSGDLTVMGNVGVGTSSPSRAFVLSGTNPFLRVNNDSTGNSALEFSTLGVSKSFIGTAGSANGLVSGSVAGDMIIRTQGKSLLFTNDSGTTAHMVLSAAGLLGLSSSTPTYLLSLGTGSTAFSVSSTGVATSTVFNAVSTSVPSIFPYASTTALTVAGDGKSLDVGSGANSLVYANFAGGRAFVGYDGNNAFIQGGNTKGLIFNVGNGTVGSGEAARFTSAGLLGIGTTTPGEKLSVDGNGLFNGKITGQYFVATSTTVASTFPYASTTALSVSGAGSAFIVSTGNVGIGNAVPTTTLDVIGTPSFIGRFAKSSTDSATAPTTVLGANYLQIGGQEYNAANTSPSLRLIGFGYNKAKTTGYSPAYIGFKETDNSASTLGNLVFYTRAVGTGTTQPSERLTIQSDGNVGVSSTTPFYLLSVGTGSSAFSVSSTGVATSTVFNATSATTPSILPLASSTALSLTGTSALYPALVINSGAIGLGTGAPTAMLTVNSTNGAANTAKILVQESRGAGNDASIQLSTTNNSNDAYIQFTRSGIGSWVIGSDGSDSNTFKIDRSTSLTTSAAFNILTGGNVGLGTSTPGTLLSLGNTGNNTINLSTSATSTFGTGINIRGGCYAVNGTCISGGSGSGTVNSGTAGYAAFYDTTGSSVSGTSTMRITSVGGVSGVIIGATSTQTANAQGLLQLYSGGVNYSQSSPRTYSNSLAFDGLTFDSYILTSTGKGYGDIVAGRSSTGGVGGSNIRLITQSSTTADPKIALELTNDQDAYISGDIYLLGNDLNSGTSTNTNGLNLNISNAFAGAGGVGGTVVIARGGDMDSSTAGAGGTVTIAGGGNETTSAPGTNNGGAGGTVNLVFGGTSQDANAGNDGTVNIGNSAGQKNANLNVYGNVNVLLSPTGGAVSTFGVCHDGTDINATGNTTVRKLVACSSAPSDLAEMYPTKSEVEPGDIVAASSDELEYMAEGGDPYNGTVTDLGTTTISILKRATKGESGVMGVISTGPFQTFGRDIQKVEGSNAKPVALVGRVPVKVTLEGGDIKPGDRITLSSTPGVGMKASTSGMTIGVAISSFNSSSPKDVSGVGKVNVFVNLSYAKLDSAVTGGNLADGLWTLDESTGRIKAFSSLDLNNMDINNVRSIQSGSGDWSISTDGILVVKEVRTQKLCLGQICITETDLKSLLDHAGLGAVITAPSGDTGSTTASSTPPNGGNGGDTPPLSESPPTDPASTEPPSSDTPPATSGDTSPPASDPTPSPTPDPAPAPTPDPTPAPAADPPPSTP